MIHDRDHSPGELAPKSGHYRLTNVFGSRTAIRVQVTQGDALPSAPHGFGWRLEHEPDPTED